MNASSPILLVGHCMADSFGLSRIVKDAIPGAPVERVNSEKALRAHLDGAALLLVNRVLDGRFDVAGGVDLIRRLHEQGSVAPMMLISNYSDAQDAAVEAGALRGFGKRELRSPATTDLVRSAVEAGSDPGA